MTGEDKTPQPWPAEPTPSTPPRKPRAEASGQPANPLSGEFGNGNIFGEAFATLLDQVEAAKQKEREREEQDAAAALSRALGRNAEAEEAAQSSSDFAAQARALREARQQAAPQAGLAQVSELQYLAPAQPEPSVTARPAVSADGDVPPEVLAQPPASAPAPSQPAEALRPKFASSGPFLARFLPDVPSSQTGIQAGFCNLHDFLSFLHEQGWHGYLYAALGEQAAYVLVYEGRKVAAACLSSTGEQALGELLHLYEQGACLSAYPLSAQLAHILSGVGSRAWKFDLTADFTGLHAQPDEATYYYQGRAVATMPVGLPYEGAFPAPLRPQTLVLPRSLAGWAHHSYVPTLRGRDALNAITPAHQAFKAKFGAGGLSLQAALIEGLTPAEYALRHDSPLHDLEPVVQELVQLGYLKNE